MTIRNWRRRALPAALATCVLASAAEAGNDITITPMADMPAPATEVNVSGNVRGLTLASKTTGEGWNTDLASRLRLYIKGKTETAVGEVGAYARLQASGTLEDGAEVDASSFFGYWKATENLTLTAGRNDTAAAVLTGADWNGTGGVWNGSAVALTDPSVTFASLGVSSGPFTVTVGLESNTTATNADDDTLETSAPAIAGSMSVKQGDFSAQASGRYQGAGDGTPEGDDGWMVGGGIGYSAGLVSAEVGAATGRGMARDFTTFDLSGFDVLGSDFMAANALLTLRMSETTRLEGFMGHATLDPSSGIVNAGAPESLTGFGGGVFWTPAAQLTLGAGASWSKTTYDTDADEDLANKHETTVGLGAWFSFRTGSPQLAAPVKWGRLFSDGTVAAGGKHLLLWLGRCRPGSVANSGNAMHRVTKAFFAALLLAGCSTGQPLQERNFAIVPGPAAVSPPLTRDLSEVISRTGNSYLTIVVSNTTERRSKTRDEVIVNNALTAGSGFLLDSDRVVTAGHVALRKALPVEARGPDGRLYTGTVLDVRPGNDMAILHLKKFDVGSPVKPAASACLKPGDTVFSLGKPHAMGDTARVGTVEAMSFGQKVAYQGFGYPDAMVVRMATRKGESGGPLFNDKGELVGMIVSTLSDQTGAPLNLAHAVTLPALADFICSTGDCPVEWAALRVQKTDNCPST